MVSNSGDALTNTQQETSYNTLLDVFTAGDDNLGHSDLLPHTIPTGTAQPIRQPPRRAPLCHKDTVVLVQKKDGSVKFCIDYCKLNAVTQQDAYPLPRIDKTLDTLSGSKWFSMLDLLSGYWQVEMDP